MYDQPYAVEIPPLRCPRAILEKETAFIVTPAPTVLAHLLPDATTLCLEACDVDDATVQITLRVRSIQAMVPCPLCTTPARRIHFH
jgi:hypothetical protein